MKRYVIRRKDTGEYKQGRVWQLYAGWTQSLDQARVYKSRNKDFLGWHFKQLCEFVEVETTIRLKGE